MTRGGCPRSGYSSSASSSLQVISWLFGAGGTPAVNSRRRPEVARAYQSIAADEIRHAALGWRVSRWIAQRLSSAFDEYCQELTPAP